MVGSSLMWGEAHHQAPIKDDPNLQHFIFFPESLADVRKSTRFTKKSRKKASKFEHADCHWCLV